MKFLLDVSTLVALLTQQHEFSSRVKAWLPGKSLAICPITEIGFIRVAVKAYGLELADAKEALKEFLEKTQPAFVPCDMAALNGTQTGDVNKTTDFYIANLAEKHGMKFATLDERIGHKAAFVIPD